MGSNNAASDVGCESVRGGAEAHTLSNTLPLSVNKIFNDATSLRRQSPSGAKPPSLIDAATSTNAL